MKHLIRLFTRPLVAGARAVLALVVVAGAACTVPATVWAQSSCQLPQNITTPTARQPDWKNTDVATDYLALVLSWSPEHCNAQKTAAAKKKHAFQCENNRFEFVVHGLWPQSNQAQSAQDHPRHCNTSDPLPVSLVRKHLCTVPGADLMQNEWQAHGTCAWPTADAYFDEIEALMGRITRPAFAAMVTQSGGSSTATVGRIKQAFVDANQGRIQPSHLRVNVGSGNWLKEVWICLPPGPNSSPMACPAGGTPDSQTVKVRAPKVPAVPPSPPSPDPGIVEPPDVADLKCPSRQNKFSGYAGSAKQALWSLYAQGGKTIYCAARFAGGSRETAGGLPMNIEHTLPKSKIKVAAGQGDLHNLWPSILKVNEARSNYAFTDNIPGEDWTFANRPQQELATCDFEVESVMKPGGKVTLVEPAPHARGRLARSVLHMALAYDVKLSEADWAMYLAWHEGQPPQADELRRNDRIEQIQRTRNPFIDSPDHGRVLVQSCRP